MHEVAIIGAGPAGMAAALQLKRCAIDFLWFEKEIPDSLLNNAHRVENYLGLPNINGINLLDCYRAHLKPYNIAPIATEVQSLDYIDNKKYFALKTAEKTYFSQRVIIASGTKAKIHPLIEALSPILKAKTSYTVTPWIKQENKIFAIIGAGDAAFDYALNLAAHNSVHIFNIKSSSMALPALVDMAIKNKNIFYHPNTELLSINTHDSSMLQLRFNQALIESDYLIAAIGREAQKIFYSKELLAKELALANMNMLFLAGDIKNGIYRQTSLAVADGILAAMMISRLRSKNESN